MIIVTSQIAELENLSCMEVPLPPMLKDFVTLAEHSSIADAIVRTKLNSLATSIQHDATDKKLINELNKAVSQVSEVYEKKIQEQMNEAGRTKKWAMVIKAGSDDFRGVYDQVWQTILSSETDALQEYKNVLLLLRCNLQASKVRQTQDKLVPLYVEAARSKIIFDKVRLKLNQKVAGY